MLYSWWQTILNIVSLIKPMQKYCCTSKTIIILLFSLLKRIFFVKCDFIITEIKERQRKGFSINASGFDSNNCFYMQHRTSSSFFSWEITFLLFLAIIEQILEIAVVSLNYLLFQILAQYSSYIEIGTLCQPVFQKLKIFVQKKPFRCQGCLKRSPIILKK